MITNDCLTSAFYMFCRGNSTLSKLQIEQEGTTGVIKSGENEGIFQRKTNGDQKCPILYSALDIIMSPI